MTKKFDAFKTELEALCKKHDVLLSTSLYDTIVAYDADPPHSPAGIHCDAIEDGTEEPAQPPAEGQA